MAFELNAATSAGDTGDAGARRKIFLAVGIVAALLLAAFAYLVSRPGAPNVEPRLANAVRPGDPEFDSFRDKLVLDNKEADQSPRAVGDIVMNLRATARNFTGRTITGLEVRGAVVDSTGNPVRERTIIALPSGSNTELATNKTLAVVVRLEGFSQSDDRSDFQLEITGVRFK